jgi:hypothetical protein
MHTVKSLTNRKATFSHCGQADFPTFENDTTNDSLPYWPSPAKRHRRRAKRYVVSDEVMEEFGMSEDYVPDLMKQNLPKGAVWVDHVGMN